MLSLGTIISFFGTSLLIAAAPGPDVLFILTQSLAYGRRAGILISLGNVSALLIPTAASALGLGVLVNNSPVAYQALKYVGVFYLVYLAYQSFTKTMVQENTSVEVPVVRKRSLALRGAIVSVTNPHMMVLFLAFIPQFIDVRAGRVAGQVVALGLLHMLSAFIVFVIVAFAADMVRRKLAESPAVFRNIDRVTGVVFVGLALRLVLG